MNAWITVGLLVTGMVAIVAVTGSPTRLRMAVMTLALTLFMLIFLTGLVVTA